MKQGQPAETRAKTAVRANLAYGLPLLTMDVIKNRTVDNLVIVACASWSSYDFALNWAAHLRAINVTNFIVGRALSISRFYSALVQIQSQDALILVTRSFKYSVPRGMNQCNARTAFRADVALIVTHRYLSLVPFRHRWVVILNKQNSWYDLKPWAEQKIEDAFSTHLTIHSSSNWSKSSAKLEDLSARTQQLWWLLRLLRW